MHEALSLPPPLISPQKASTSKKSSREDGPPTSGSGASSAGSAPSAAASAARRKVKTGGCPHLVQRGEVWEDFVDEVLGQPLDVEVRGGPLALVPDLAASGACGGAPGVEGLQVWRGSGCGGAPGVEGLRVWRGSGCGGAGRWCCCQVLALRPEHCISPSHQTTHPLGWPRPPSHTGSLPLPRT